MSRRHVVLVSRRFWPLVGGAETAMSLLAGGLLRRGAAVTLLTWAWHDDWPAAMDFNGVRVVRLPRHRGLWFAGRQIRELHRWLEQHRDAIDLVCVSGLRLEAWAAARVCRRRHIPLVLRAEAAGSTGDCVWHAQSRLGRRIQRECKSADAIIAVDAAVEAELRAAGFDRARIGRIANGVAPMTSASRSRFDARLALADSNDDLTAGPETPIAVFLGRLHPARGLLRIVRAWPDVLHRVPDARLWLFGDGPDRDRLFREIKDHDLRRLVCLPGTIDDAAEALHAADLFVSPCDEPGLPQAMLEALAARRPVIAADTPDQRHLQRQVGDALRLVASADPAAWSRTLVHLLQHPPSPESLAAAHKNILREHSTPSMVEAHWRWFERLWTKDSARQLP